MMKEKNFKQINRSSVYLTRLITVMEGELSKIYGRVVTV